VASDDEAQQAAAEGGEARPPRQRRPRGRRAGEGADGENAEPLPFACTDCDRTFASQQGVRRHLEAKHPDAPATKAAVEVAKSEPRPAPVRRGGRPPAGTTTSDANAAANGDAAPRRRQGGRPPRGGGRGPQAAGEADAAGAAARALDGDAGEPAEPRMVPLYRCTLCQMGFRSRNRARTHVADEHSAQLAAAAVPPPGTDGAVPEDALLGIDEVRGDRLLVVLLAWKCGCGVAVALWAKRFAEVCGSGWRLWCMQARRGSCHP
jgi:hypothetical protein